MILLWSDSIDLILFQYYFMVYTILGPRSYTTWTLNSEWRLLSPVTPPCGYLLSIWYCWSPGASSWSFLIFCLFQRPNSFFNGLMIDKFNFADEYFCTTMCSKVLCRSNSKVVYVPLIHIYKGIDSISEIQFISWICELNDIVVSVEKN